MKDQNKKIALIVIGSAVVLATGYFLWQRLSVKYGPGKVDSDAKRNRTFNISR